MPGNTDAKARPDRIPRVLLPLGYMAVLLLLSSIPGTSGPVDFSLDEPDSWLSPSIQNLLHVPVYGVLTFLWWWFWSVSIGSAPIRAAAAFSISLAYGGLDESYQALIPGRTSSIEDFLFDGIGAALGSGLVLGLHRYRVIR